MLPDPNDLARRLLGGAPESVAPLVARGDHAAHLMTVRGRRFVVKTDLEPGEIEREVAGQLRAAGAGVPVPEIVAVESHAFAMLWVDGVSLAELPTSAAAADTGRHLRTLHDLGGSMPAVPPPPNHGGPEAGPMTVLNWLAPRLEWCEREVAFPASQAARIRAAIAEARAAFEGAQWQPVWCHGDFQDAHVIIDPATMRVRAFIDFADNATGDPAWDVAVCTLDIAALYEPLLEGYGADAAPRERLARIVPLYQVLRLLDGVRWFSDVADLVNAADHLARASTWRG